MLLVFGVSAALVLLLMILVAYLAVYQDGSREPSGNGGILAPPQVLKRLFDQTDWEYVAVHCSPTIRARFERERSRLALAWLREARLAVSLLWREHRTAAGESQGLAPAMEFRLAVKFSLFWAASLLVSVLVATNHVLAIRRLWRAASAPARMVGMLTDSLRVQLVPHEARL